ncbi:hypothetical protein BN2497_11313 [Janthinobacterium sp. CG23_2]|nr:hypothetical protein BN2497_11313 [Janthinobacterium sp. CG23_2]CUU32054.1 hypothetical protein BN3177_11313 [Janthinobacterium sp. CG23_2]
MDDLFALHGDASATRTGGTTVYVIDSGIGNHAGVPVSARWNAAPARSARIRMRPSWPGSSRPRQRSP